MKSKSKQKYTKLLYYLTVLLTVSVGACCGILVPKYFSLSPYGTPSSLTILIVTVILCFYVSIILHECGHLLFGLLTGYRFLSFRFLSFMIVRTDGKTSFKLLSLSGVPGQCLLAPPDMKDGKFPYRLYNLGGILLNLFSALLFGALALFLKELFFLRTAFIALFSINLLLLISNGIPNASTPVSNDARNLCSMSNSPAGIRALWIQLKINEETTKGVRISQMPEQWFSLPDDAELDNPLVATLIAFRINRLMDMQRLDEALDLIVKYKSTEALPEIYRNLMSLDEISIRAILGQDYASVAAAFTKGAHTLMAQMKTFPSVIRTRYIFALLIENNRQAAAKMKEAFEKIKKTYPYKTDIKSEEALMLLAEQSLQSEADSDGEK